MHAGRQRSAGREADTRLVALVGAELLGAALVYRIGSGPWSRIDWGHLSRWLRTTTPDDAVVAVLRVAAIVGVAWLLLSTATYLVASATGRRRCARLAGWITLPAVRRLVDAALAASLIGGMVGGNVAAYAARGPSTTAPPITIEIGQQPASGGGPAAPRQHAYVPVPAGDPKGRPSDPPPSPAPPTTTAPPRPAPVVQPVAPQSPPPAAPAHAAVTTYVVRAGDNLWTIAAHHLAESTARPLVRLGRGEIARYWLAVISANEGKLPSGDPNLIHPGEQVILPVPPV